MKKDKNKSVDPLTALVLAKRKKAQVKAFKKAARTGKSMRSRREYVKGVVHVANPGDGTPQIQTLTPEFKRMVAAEYVKQNCNMRAVSRNLKINHGTVITLVKRDKVCMAAIHEIGNTIADDGIMGSQELLRRLSSQARGNIADYMEVTEDGDLVACMAMGTYEQLSAVSSIEQEEVYETVSEMDEVGAMQDKLVRVRKIKFRMHNVLEAEKLLGQYHKLFAAEGQAGAASNQPPPAMHVHFTDEPGLEIKK